MTKAAVAHLTQRVDCAAIGSNRDWIGRHCMRQRGNLGILAFGKCTHRITTGEDASQALQVVDYQHRARTVLPHTAAGLLHRLMLRQQQRFLVFDDIGELSVGHDASVLARAKVP